MKVISLVAENVKRIVVVDITPTKNVVEITGPNGSGKTSVLDAIHWTICGTKPIQSSPIRKGAEEARIRLDLGELVVTRRFASKAEGGFTTSLRVESADGASFKSPQAVLDALIGELAFDPLEFTRRPAKAQFDALRRFVPGVDFDKLDGLNKSDYDKRTDANRRAKQLRAQADGIPVPANAPKQRVSESALVEQMQVAGERNADIERERGLRNNKLRAKEAYLQTAQRHTEHAADLRSQAKEADRLAAEDAEAAKRIDMELAEAAPIPEIIDVSDIRAQIEAARQVNIIVDKAERRQELIADAEIAEAVAEQLTQTMQARNEAKLTAIAAAQMPVEGLGFGDGYVTLNGVPFEQASDAEQLRASIAIAASMNPKLRVIRVRDGSLLDDNGMKLLADYAEKNDLQIWVERVSTDGKVGFVLEDGQLKNSPAMQAAE